MRVELIKDMRIKHKAGDIVEVSPEACNFLVSIGAAKVVKEQPVKEQPKQKKKG